MRDTNRKTLRAERLGEVGFCKKTGEKLTIIEYYSSAKVVVQFETGEKAVTNYDRFRKGTVRKPVNRIGERKLQNCGAVAEITAWRSNVDIDVRFDNGVTRDGVVYAAFIKGSVAMDPIARRNKPAVKYANERIGQKFVANDGEPFEIIAYRSSMDCDIRFRDGTVKCNLQYSTISRGEVSKTKNRVCKNRIGETRTMNSGKKATIIGYRNAHDIDLEFETGIKRYGVSYSDFCNGEVLELGVGAVGRTNDTLIKDRTGEERIINGKRAKIIAYRRSEDIDVEFETGTVRRGVDYKGFIGGYLSENPTANKDLKNQLVGQQRMNGCGLCGTAIDRHGRRLTVEFEDGTIIQDILPKRFNIGDFVHPAFGQHTKEYLGFTKIKREFKLADGRVFYSVTTPDGVRKVMTPQMMLEVYRKRKK